MNPFRPVSKTVFIDSREPHPRSLIGFPISPETMMLNRKRTFSTTSPAVKRFASNMEELFGIGGLLTEATFGKNKDVVKIFDKPL